VTSLLVRFPFVNMHCNFVNFGDLAFLTASVLVKKGCSLANSRCFSLWDMHVTRQCTDTYLPPLVLHTVQWMQEKKNAQGDLVNSLRSHCLWVAKQELGLGMLPSVVWSLFQFVLMPFPCCCTFFMVIDPSPHMASIYMLAMEMDSFHSPGFHVQSCYLR
jgi:hypothetical protein